MKYFGRTERVRIDGGAELVWWVVYAAEQEGDYSIAGSRQVAAFATHHDALGFLAALQKQDQTVKDLLKPQKPAEPMPCDTCPNGPSWECDMDVGKCKPAEPERRGT